MEGALASSASLRFFFSFFSTTGTTGVDTDAVEAVITAGTVTTAGAFTYIKPIPVQKKHWRRGETRTVVENKSSSMAFPLPFALTPSFPRRKEERLMMMYSENKQRAVEGVNGEEDQ